MKKDAITHRIIRVAYPDGTEAYFLTTRSEPPYLKQTLDWGSFRSAESARLWLEQHAKQSHRAKGVITILDHQCKSVAWASMQTTFRVFFKLPLSEFTERLVLWNPESPEARALGEELAIEFKANPERLDIQVQKIRLNELALVEREQSEEDGSVLLKFFVAVDAFVTGPNTAKTRFMNVDYLNTHAPASVRVPFLGDESFAVEYDWS